MTQSSMTPHPSVVVNSTRPDACQSSWAITPVRTNPNFICPSRDSRQALVVESPAEKDNDPAPKSKTDNVTTTISSDSDAVSVAPATKKNKKKNKRKCPSKVINVDSNSDKVKKSMDLTQDSDEENSKVKKKNKKVADPKKDFDDVELYFHNPTMAEVCQPNSSASNQR
jgi:hypothetical protein